MQPRINSASKAAGFSLIELIITLALVSFLLLMGGSLTSAWIDRSKVDNAAAMLKSATSFARSAALRNKDNLASDSLAIAVCIQTTEPDADQLKISVQRVSGGSPCNASSGSNHILKEFELAKGVTIEQEEEPLQCIAFNANGLVNETECNGRLDLEITTGKNNEERKFKLI